MTEREALIEALERFLRSEERKQYRPIFVTNVRELRDRAKLQSAPVEKKPG